MQEKSKKNTEISERISQVIKYLSVTPNKFAIVLGYKRTQSIYDILDGKSAPSFDFFKKLFNSEYSALINPFWIFTGRGELSVGVNNMRNEYAIINSCLLCSEKDQTIMALKEGNIALREALEVYKEKCGVIKSNPET